jgi:hypothetical protein
MDTLARQDVRQTDPRGQHLHPDLASFRSGDVFFDDGDHFRATDSENTSGHFVDSCHDFPPFLLLQYLDV